MRNRKGGLQQDEAGGGLRERDPTPHRGAHQHVVIDIRIVAAQSEFKPVLAGQCAVTSALIATHLGHHRNHVVFEIPSERRGCVRDVNLDTGFPALRGARDRYLAIRQGFDDAAGIHGCDL